MVFFKLKKTANLAKRSHEHLVKEIKKTVSNSELFKAFFQEKKGQKASIFLRGTSLNEKLISCRALSQNPMFNHMLKICHITTLPPKYDIGIFHKFPNERMTD